MEATDEGVPLSAATASTPDVTLATASTTAIALTTTAPSATTTTPTILTSPVVVKGNNNATAIITTTASATSTSSSIGATSFVNIVSAASPPTVQQQAPTTSSAHQLLLDEGNSLSHLGATTSEGQRSISAAPSASSSPIQSPPGKIFGRNANGTMIATTRPMNEAEVQLYRVLQRASLLSYYDTLLEMGGDDVQQLYEAGEEEFLEIMALVGMASKPLHVRRLQKALHEWANNPALFQGPFNPGAPVALGETTPTKSRGLVAAPAPPAAFYAKQEQQSPSLSLMRCGVGAGGTGGVGSSRYPTYTPNTPAMFNPTPLLSGLNTPTAVPAPSSSSSSSTASFLSQLCSTPAITVPVIQPHAALVLPSAAPSQLTTVTPPAASAGTIKVGAVPPSTTPLVQPQQQLPTAPPSASVTTHQVTSSSHQAPQLTPALTESQIARITQGAEKIAAQLPQREPRAQTMKKRATRELEQVIAMSKDDPRRMDEIRKYSAIYGRFDCKRRPEKPLTLHEVCVNEAAAQLCRLVPALLTRRDELFPLARQIVKDVGFGHSASIARYGNLLPQIQQTQAAAAAAAAAAASAVNSMTTPANTTQRCSVVVDCESSDSSSATMSTNGAKRKRLAFSDAASSMGGGESVAPELSRESTEDSRYNLFAMYQKFAKPPFDLTDIAKFSFGKADYDEDPDNDSRFSFSNSGSPPMPPNGADLSETRTNHLANSACHWPLANQRTQEEVHSTAIHISQRTRSTDRDRDTESASKVTLCDSEATIAPTTHAGVHVISAAAAGHIIAVANPALALSPTLNEALSLKREADSPDM